MDKNMVIARTEDLSRDEILNILQKRHLYINDMHVLTHSELVRVYKTFVLPMSRRPQRHKHLAHHPAGRRLAPPNEEDDQMTMAKESNTERMPMDIDISSEAEENNHKYKAASNIIYNPIGDKRRPTDDAWTEDYQYHLSKATKRIRIDPVFSY